jgi:ATP-binding cassette, subfamily B, bacterial
MSPEFRRALAYIAPYWRRLSLVVGLSLLNTVLALSLPYFSKLLIDRALIGRDERWLVAVVCLFAAASLAGFVLTAVVGLRYTRVSADVLFDMRLALYRHLQRLSPRFYAKMPLGDILARINADVSEIQRVAAESLLSWVGNLFFLVGSLAAMCWLDIRLTLIGVALVPLAVWVLGRTRSTLAIRVRRVREASARTGSFLIETLQAVRLVVTSNAEEREAGRFRAFNDKFVEALMSMQLWSYASTGGPGAILAIGTAAAFLYGGHRVITETMSLGTFVAFMAYYMQLFQPVQSLMGLYSNFATVQVSLSRVHELLDAPPDVVETSDALHLDRVRGAVTFENVSLDLGRGQVLQDVSFALAPGETVALVGPSGSGKSTIADLLVRLVDPDAGMIRLDGCDIRRLALGELRRHIVLVDQQPLLLHASIAENIRYARPEASDADVLRAALDAGLDDVLNRLPEGLQTIVGERGAALSAGERQRVAVARALLLTPDVLVLDEPTAALDSVSEQQVLDGYARIMSGRTTIVITHRRALASAADRILVLTDRAVIEEGAPADVLTPGRDADLQVRARRLA